MHLNDNKTVPQPNEDLYSSLLALMSAQVQEVYCAEIHIATNLRLYQYLAVNTTLK